MIYINKFNVSGFTLAEVLLTLLIIGIVASLTIPALINDIQNQEYKVALKKSFASISLVMKTAYSESEDLTTYDDRWNSLVKRFSTVKICNGQTFGNCLPNGGITPDSLVKTGCGSIKVLSQANTSAFVTNEGMVWLRETAKSTNETFNIGVDVNGIKGPNQWGKDAFMFLLDSKGRVTPSACDLSGNSKAYILN